jgi:hypothetical protein
MLDSAGQPASAVEAIAAVTAGLGFLARADAASMGSAAQAECLKALEAAEAVHTAARVNVLAAFSAGVGYEDDGCGSTRAWLMWQTRVTRGAAAGAFGWMRRLRGHRAIWAALAAAEISSSWARQLCEWNDRLPEESREDADAILLAAAAGGACLGDLGALAQEMYERSCPADGDEGGPRFGDRALYFAQTFGNAGRLEGDLTPAAGAALRAVLDSLGAKAGPEDIRTKPQREHDALEEACIRLIGSGMLPQRAGQPVHLQLQITLRQLREMAGASGAEAAWADRASGLTDAEARALACDATIFPTVMGTVDEEALDDLVQLFLTMTGHGRNADSPGHGADVPGRGQDPSQAADPADSAEDADAGVPELAIPPALRSAERLLRRALLARAADVLSGPGGLAAALRQGLLERPFSTYSLPLDVGAGVEVIPGHLRRAVILRDKHCRFPGCLELPSVCHVHHLIHREDGGRTALDNCYLLCRFHHLIVIHRWGWKLTVHPDGTTTATSPTGRTLHSHSPPGSPPSAIPRATPSA